MEYGIEGYGLYYLCMELISGDITIDNLTFELEDDAELIAHEFKMDTIRVEKIMHRCIELGLFDLSDNGRIRCLTLAKMLDESISKNTHVKEIKKKITEKLDNTGNLPEPFRRPSAQKRREENRIDKNRKDKKKKEEKTSEPDGSFRKHLIDHFDKTYLSLNGQKMDWNTKEIGQIGLIIKKYKEPDILRKCDILESKCRDPKNTFFQFLPSKLSNQWNSLVPQKTKEPEMSLEERIKKNEEELGNIFEGGN